MTITRLHIEAVAKSAGVTVPPDSDAELGSWRLFCIADKALGSERFEAAVRAALLPDETCWEKRKAAAIATLRRAWAEFIPA